MKKTVFIILAILISANTASAYSNYGNGFNAFYSSLQPYGEWIEIDYDLYAWQPYNVRYDWRPYSDGRWEWTMNGWYWVSYEPFGWATYHYGRWYFDDYYGWLWIPDTEWGPSWVEWRYNNNYIGWAPLPPYARFNRLSGIHFSINWNSGYYHWNFVNYHHFRRNNINVYLVNHYDSYNIFNKTKYRTNYYHRDGRIVNGGVDRKFVERRSGYKIRERNIETTSDVQTYRTRSNDNSRDNVISYKPRISEDEKSSAVEKKNIRKGGGNSSLQKDRIINERSDVNNKSTEIIDRNNSERSAERKITVNKSDIEKDISKRTPNFGERGKEKSPEVKMPSKPAETSKSKNTDVKKRSESSTEKKLTKPMSKTESKKVKADRTIKRMDSSAKKKVVKNAENQTEKKRKL